MAVNGIAGTITARRAMKAAATWLLGAGSIVIYAWFARSPVPLPSSDNQWALTWTVVPSIVICLVIWLAFQEQEKADYERTAEDRVKAAVQDAARVEAMLVRARTDFAKQASDALAKKGAGWVITPDPKPGLDHDPYVAERC